MDKRVLLTVAISMAILFVWSKFFAPPPPPAPAHTAAATAPSPEPGSPQVAANPANPAASPGPAVAQKERPPEVKAPIKEKDVSGTLTNWGAAPDEWLLLHPQYQEKVDGKQQPINLVRTKSPNLPLSISFPESTIPLPADAAWTPLADGLGYSIDQGALHVEKRFVPSGYSMQVKILVENRGDAPITQHLQLAVYGHQDPNVKQGGMFSARVTQTEGLCHVNGKLRHNDLQSLLKERTDEVGPVRFIGVDEKYFLVAAAINPGADMLRCSVGATPDGLITTSVMLTEKKLAPHEKAEFEVAAFLGPKLLDKLDAVKVGGVDAKLGDAINYGWTEAIARPMLAVLKGVHFVVPNWGLAVIVLTLLLKVITWWPTTKSMKSMKAMAKLKPEMDKLKEKYGDDKNRMNQEVMELYKKHGINPLGGCLPMLIQMPIYIALYSMLGNSVELYHSGFLGWIHDLTAPDAYFVLPLLTGVLMFAQQKLSPTPPDPQQKMMAYMMPVMFTAISLFLPSGLTIYILTNTLLTMLQQWWMNRNEPKPEKVSGKPARA